MSFETELDAEFEDAMDEVGVVKRKISLQALEGVVLKTPVDTGRARGAWLTTIGKETDEEPERLDPNGTIAIGEGTATILTDSDPFSVVILQNNLPYVERLENGHSQWAPDGMVALTVAEIETQFK